MLLTALGFWSPPQLRQCRSGRLKFIVLPIAIGIVNGAAGVAGYLVARRWMPELPAQLR